MLTLSDCRPSDSVMIANLYALQLLILLPHDAYLAYLACLCVSVGLSVSPSHVCCYCYMYVWYVQINTYTHTHTHTHTHNRFTALWKLSGTTRVSRYQKKHSPTTLIVVINHPYLLSPSTTTHGILRIQSTCSTVFFHNLSLQINTYLLTYLH